MSPWVFFSSSCTLPGDSGSFHKWNSVRGFLWLCLTSDLSSGDLSRHWPLGCGTREMEANIWNAKPIRCYHDACMWPRILLQGTKDHSLPGQWNLELSGSQTSLWEYVELYHPSLIAIKHMKWFLDSKELFSSLKSSPAGTLGLHQMATRSERWLSMEPLPFSPATQGILWWALGYESVCPTAFGVGLKSNV